MGKQLSRSGWGIFIILFVLFFISRSHNIMWGSPFSLSGDEFNSYRDAMLLDFSQPPMTQYPLYYLLSGILIRLFGYQDVMLRIVPYTFSLISFPIFFLFIARRYGVFTASIFSILITFSPIHLYFSTMARFYAETFFLIGVYLLILSEYVCLKKLSIRQIIALIFLAAVAVLFHTVSIIAIFASLLCLLAMYLKNQMGKLQQKQLILIVGLCVVCLVLLFSGVVAVFGGLERIQFDVRRPLKAIRSALYDVTPGICSFSILYGIYLLRKTRRPDIGFFIGTIVISYGGFFAISLVHKQGCYGQYLYNVMFLFIVLAAIGINHWVNHYQSLLDKCLITLLVCGMLISPNLPAIYDFYRDGDRYNYKAAVAFVEQHAQPGDVLYAQAISHMDKSKSEIYAQSIHTAYYRGPNKRIQFAPDYFIHLDKYIDLDTVCLKRNALWFILIETYSPCYTNDNALFCRITEKMATIGVKNRFNHHNRKLVIYKTHLPPCSPQQ